MGLNTYRETNKRHKQAKNLIKTTIEGQQTELIYTVDQGYSFLLLKTLCAVKLKKLFLYMDIYINGNCSLYQGF